MFQRTYCEICVEGMGGGLCNIPSNPSSPLTRWTEAISQSCFLVLLTGEWQSHIWKPGVLVPSLAPPVQMIWIFFHNRIQASILPQLCQIWFYQHHPEHPPGKLKRLKHQHEYSPGEQTKEALSAGRVKKDLTVSDRHHRRRMQGDAIHVTSPYKCNSHHSHST